MLDGHLLVDVHVHAPRLPTLRPAWIEWASEFGRAHPWPDLYDTPVPERMDAHFEGEGVDAALLFSEYSPKATGEQPIEDLLPMTKHNPRRFRAVANVNPRVHHPIADEVARQVGLGAVALKLHPVHAGFDPGDTALYRAYQASGLPPSKLATYYAKFDLARLAKRFIFGTDWPGMPGVARNARAIAKLGWDDETVAGVWALNALRVFPALRDLAGTEA